MKLTQKTIAALALPESKTETIVFDDDLNLARRTCGAWWERNDPQ
jgi:hypothetical protein